MNNQQFSILSFIGVSYNIKWWSLPALFFALFLTSCAGASNLAVAPGPASDPGRKIYLTRCAKCHKFYNPAAYTDKEWAKWMQKMQKKAKLSDAQEALLSSYINENLRPGGGSH